MKIDYEYINDLKEVIDSNKDKRICVVGTSCTGKTTYLEYAKNMKESIEKDLGETPIQVVRIQVKDKEPER